MSECNTLLLQPGGGGLWFVLIMSAQARLSTTNMGAEAKNQHGYSKHGIIMKSHNTWTMKPTST